MTKPDVQAALVYALLVGFLGGSAWWFFTTKPSHVQVWMSAACVLGAFVAGCYVGAL